MMASLRTAKPTVAPEGRSFAAVGHRLLQRKCACGGTPGPSGECEECEKKRKLQRKSKDQSTGLSAMQFKLAVGASNDAFEQEADRVADHVLATRANPAVQSAPLHIQRFTSQSSGLAEEAPASVDGVLAGAGRPLEAGLREDMGLRFGHDFSQVRVHSGGAAGQSAQDVNADAYTVGHNIVFGDGRFAPGTHEGRRLLAHELTHVVQQSAAERIHPNPSHGYGGQSSVSANGNAGRVVQRAPAAGGDCAAAPGTPAKPSKKEFAANEDLQLVRLSIFDLNHLGLRPGDGGPGVALIQRLLLNTVCAGVDRKALQRELGTKKYGAATSQAVKRFQREHSDALGHPLPPDGHVGPLTLGAMDAIVGLVPYAPARDPEGKGTCYGVAEQGPGEHSILSADKARATPILGFFPSEAVWQLSNFDIAKHFVKTEHRTFLRDVVVKEINKRPADKYVVRLIGEASTTAAQSFDQPLSEARVNCVRHALLEAGLDSESRLEHDAAYGKTYAKVRRVMAGKSPTDLVEDRSARQVSIVLAPRVSKTDDCSLATKIKASSIFMARVSCGSPTLVRVNIGDFSDPNQLTYREFVWVHRPWPAGCIFINGQPPVTANFFQLVKTEVPFHLAIRDPDQIYAPSEFTGNATQHDDTHNSILVGDQNPFRMDFDGLWQPKSCGDKASQTAGWLTPVGPVKCGEVPTPPAGHCEAETKEEKKCTDDYKKSESRHFTGIMGGGSTDISRYLPVYLRPFLKLGLAGLVVAYGTTDLDGPQISRAFLFTGLGLNGAGEGLDQLKVASAPEKELGTPQQLSTGGYIFNSDFNEFIDAKLVIHGASNKIDIDAGNAGTFTFFSALCNHGGTRTYRGVVHSISPVVCPADLGELGFREINCATKEECPESVRLAGHKSFTIKVGRATLASLPPAGRALAEKYGCKVTAAFLNIQSEDGPEEERIHREFILMAHNDDCQFTVGQGQAAIKLDFKRHLATKEPDRVFAPSDFAGLALLQDGGDMRIWSATNLPVKFTLPGAFDPTCAGQRGATGVVAPISVVDCGKTPEPVHDTTPDVSDVDKCNSFKTDHPGVVSSRVGLLDIGAYNDLLSSQFLPSPAFVAPNDDYDGWLSQPDGSTITNGMFAGLVIGPTGKEIKVVAFADFKILSVNPDRSITIQFLSNLCAFDGNGNVVLITPEQCIDTYARAGEVKTISPVPYGSGGSDVSEE